MNHSPQGHNLAAVHSLLMAVLDDPGLDAFCLAHFTDVYDKFSRGLRKDEKITMLVDHCRRSPTCIDALLDAVRKINEPMFMRYEPYLLSDRLVFGTVISTSPADLIAELAEWKLVHNEAQALLSVIGIPLDYLTDCRFSPDRTKLDDAGFKWQRLCVPKLKDVPDRWGLERAYTPAIDDLRDRASRRGEITRKLMQIEPTGKEFTDLYLQFEEFRGILWDLLTAADKRIMVLIETLQPMTRE